MLDRLERLVEPFPEPASGVPPRAFFAFLWAGTKGLRGWLALLTVLSGAIGLFEAWLYSLLADLVDWLARVEPARLWETEGARLLALAAILAASVGLVGVQTSLKHQSLAGNFPMRLRWNFHRLMLGQSMGFYQDEFAGRIATKVMQTALAVRDTWFIVTELIVFVVVYFATMLAVLGGFDVRMLAPFLVWLALYAGALSYFVPRLGRVAKAQADARSLMTGRMSDAYTNIATVKLFSHARREATYARGAMGEFLGTVHRQMRYVTGFEIVNHTLSMALVGSTVGLVLWLWTRGEAGAGAVAASTAMAMRLNGISHWVMWEMTALFENIGTVQDGLTTIAKPHAVVDRADAKPIVVARGEIRFDRVTFRYGGTTAVIDDLSLAIRAGEKIGLVGRSGAGKSTIVNLLLRFYDVESGTISIDGQDIARATQESLRAQ
ncbi:MAG: ABC transporter ATP-binding protein, partial [Burkholderiales bacterium]|nr:ABC transporter ATP-binding protein [Burkholderiales bacterium]